MSSLYRRQQVRDKKHTRAYRKFLRGEPVWARFSWYTPERRAAFAYGEVGQLWGVKVITSSFWATRWRRKPNISPQRRRGSRYVA